MSEEAKDGINTKCREFLFHLKTHPPVSLMTPYVSFMPSAGGAVV